MCLDGLEQITSAAIVEEEDALAKAPQRRCAEHVSSGKTLRDVVSEALAHVVDQQVGISMDGEIFECVGLALWRRDHGRRVASEASDARIGRIGAEELQSTLSAMREG